MPRMSQKEYQVLIDTFINASKEKYGSYSYATGWLSVTMASMLANPTETNADSNIRFLINAIDRMASPSIEEKVHG